MAVILETTERKSLISRFTKWSKMQNMRFSQKTVLGSKKNYCRLNIWCFEWHKTLPM